MNTMFNNVRTRPLNEPIYPVTNSKSHLGQSKEPDLGYLADTVKRQREWEAGSLARFTS